MYMKIAEQDLALPRTHRRRHRLSLLFIDDNRCRQLGSFNMAPSLGITASGQEANSCQQDARDQCAVKNCHAISRYGHLSETMCLG